MPTTFYVPVERTNMPPDNPLRWMILPVECSNPIDAMQEASRITRKVMRIRAAAVWAAVRDIPSFEYMQELRDAYGRKSRKGSRVVAGYC